MATRSVSQGKVLILVVVDDGLVLGVKTKQKIINNLVLILVVVDDGLVLIFPTLDEMKERIGS